MKNKKQINPVVINDLKLNKSNFTSKTTISQYHIQVRPPQSTNQQLNNSNLINQRQIQCPICYEMSTQIYSLGKCDHQFCRTCCFQYINQKVKLKQIITCPQEKCSEFLITNIPRQKVKSYFFDILHEKEQKKLKKYERNLNKNKSKTLICKNCQYISLEESNIQFSQKKLKLCQDCQHQQLNLSNNIKKCPKCSRLLQKIKGCNHVTCFCEYQFCFDCMLQWDESHICQHRIQDRTGIAFVLCFILKIIVAIPLLIILISTWIILILTICFISSLLSGFLGFIKIMESLSIIKINDCIKFLCFILVILMFPVFLIILAIPGFVVPLINIFYEEKIIMDPNLVKTITIRIFSCLQIHKIF